MTFFELIVLMTVLGLAGLGITLLLHHLFNKPREDAVSKCLEQMVAVREMAGQNNPQLLPEIQSRLAYIRRLCQKHKIELSEIDSDSEEIATILNRASQASPPEPPNTPIDIGIDEDEEYTSFPEPEQAEESSAKTEGSYELDVGLDNLNFPESSK